jgi:streptogramin lyase
VFGGKTTRLYTFTGSSSTTRTLTGLPGRVVVKNDGVFLETYTYSGNTDNGVDGITYLYKITAEATADPRIIEARLRAFQVSAEGTIYAVINDPASTPVVVISADGTDRSTVTLPGTQPQVSGSNRILGAGQQADDHGYVTYAANGSTYLAVLNDDGSVDRTIALPAGTVAGSVFFGPDGAAYLLSQVRQLGGAATAEYLLTLSNDTFSPVVNGPVLDQTSDVQFGADGSGYLILRNDPALGVQIRGFDASGLTGVELTLTDPVVTQYGSFPKQALVFGPDGTAYVASNASDDAGVYALTTTGVTKVLDLDGTPPRYLPVVGPDGTVYVTTATFDGFTIVRTIAPVSVV